MMNLLNIVLPFCRSAILTLKSPFSTALTLELCFVEQSATTTLSVVVTDVNDNSPVFTNIQPFRVKENLNNEFVGTVTVSKLKRCPYISDFVRNASGVGLVSFQKSFEGNFREILICIHLIEFQ